MLQPGFNAAVCANSLFDLLKPAVNVWPESRSESMCPCGEFISWESAAEIEDPRTGGGCNVTDAASHVSSGRDVG